jgi:hypothetical protein
MKTGDALFSHQLLLPVCDPKRSGIKDDAHRVFDRLRGTVPHHSLEPLIATLFYTEQLTAEAKLEAELEKADEQRDGQAVADDTYRMTERAKNITNMSDQQADDSSSAYRTEVVSDDSARPRSQQSAQGITRPYRTKPRPSETLLGSTLFSLLQPFIYPRMS